MMGGKPLRSIGATFAGPCALFLLVEGLFNQGVIALEHWRPAAPYRFQKLTPAGNRQILTDVTKDALKAAPAFEYAGAIGRSWRQLETTGRFVCNVKRTERPNVRRIGPPAGDLTRFICAA